MFCAACGALTGNRAAWVLVPATALCLFLDYLGVPFSLVRWLIFDLAAMTLIVVLVPKMTRVEWAILWLFLVGWAAYLLGDPFRYIGSMVITVVQLLLTFPLAKAWRLLTRTSSGMAGKDDFDLMVSA